MLKLLYKKSVEEYYAEEKNEYVFFKDWEHVTHSFFNISGELAREYNVGRPRFIFQKYTKFQGLDPFWRSASSVFIDLAIRNELKSSVGKLELVFAFAWVFSVVW